MVTLVTSHATYPTRVPNYSRVAKQGNNHRQLTLIGFGFCISHPTGQFDLNERTFENTWLIWNFVPPSLPSKYWFWISCLLAVKTLFLKPVGVKKIGEELLPKHYSFGFGRSSDDVVYQIISSSESCMPIIPPSTNNWKKKKKNLKMPKLCHFKFRCNITWRSKCPLLTELDW